MLKIESLRASIPVSWGACVGCLRKTTYVHPDVDGELQPLCWHCHQELLAEYQVFGYDRMVKEIRQALKEGR